MKIHWHLACVLLVATCCNVRIFFQIKEKAVLLRCDVDSLAFAGCDGVSCDLQLQAVVSQLTTSTDMHEDSNGLIRWNVRVQRKNKG